MNLGAFRRLTKDLPDSAPFVVMVTTAPTGNVNAVINTIVPSQDKKSIHIHVEVVNDSELIDDDDDLSGNDQLVAVDVEIVGGSLDSEDYLINNAREAIARYDSSVEVGGWDDVVMVSPGTITCKLEISDWLAETIKNTGMSLKWNGITVRSR